MKKVLLYTILLLSFICTPVSMAEVVPDVDENEPVVTIRKGEKATYYEYRINGQLKEIKVEPVIGKTYYLVPKGEGEFEKFDSSTLMLPKWILFSW